MPSHLTDYFVSRLTLDVGGAKVVTDRNLAFVREAATEGGRECVVLSSPPRHENMDVTDRLLFLVFRLHRQEVSSILAATLRGEAAHVWLDHAVIGLVAPLLRLAALMARLRGRTAPCIHLFHHNDEVRYLRDSYRDADAQRPRLRSLRLALTWLQQTAGRLCADRNYFISPAELRGRRAMVLPPTWPPAAPGPLPTQQDYVLLVGSRFFANEQGFRWFIDIVADKIPAPTRIVGRDMDSVFASRGPVTVMGFVPDLDDLYARARIVAVPIFLGAGTKVKLVEALNKGCQVIASVEACEGISDRAALVAAGQLLPATAETFTQRLQEELTTNPKGIRFPPDRYAHARYLPSFLQFYHGQRG